jgi:hypothetical protein
LAEFVRQLTAADQKTLASIASTDREPLELEAIGRGTATLHTKLTAAQTSALGRLTSATPAVLAASAWQDVVPTPAKCDDWRTAQASHTLRLRITVNRKDVDKLPTDAHFVDRKNDNALIAMPSVIKALLPTDLSLQAVSGRQFALRGPRAGLIDGVSLSNASGAWTFGTVAGPDYVVFDFSVGGLLAVPGSSKPESAKATDAALKPGSYTVRPLFSIGTKKTGYMVIDAAGDDGKPLTLSVPEAPKADSNPADEPGTITTTKKTTTDTTVKTNTKETPKNSDAVKPDPAKKSAGGTAGGAGGSGSR